MIDQGEFDASKAARRAILVRRVSALISLVELVGLLVWTTHYDFQLRSPVALPHLVGFGVVAALGVGVRLMCAAVLQPLVGRGFIDEDEASNPDGERTFVVALVFAGCFHMSIWLNATNHAPSVEVPVRITECHEGDRGTACSGAWTVNGVRHSGIMPHDPNNETAYYTGTPRMLKVSTQHPDVVVSNDEGSFLYALPIIAAVVLIYRTAKWLFAASEVTDALRAIKRTPSRPSSIVD